jgi:hypothetical protein
MRACIRPPGNPDATDHTACFCPRGIRLLRSSNNTRQGFNELVMKCPLPGMLAAKKDNENAR